jgi:hypothetical protein
MRFSVVERNLTLVFNVNIDGAPAPLSGATVTLFVPGNATASFVLTNGADGVCSLVILADNFAVGQYLCHLQYAKSPTLLKSRNKFNIYVEP